MIQKVAVVILNFKVKEEIKKCIKSVLSSTYTNVEIIVVDNNSQDGLEKEMNSTRLLTPLLLEILYWFVQVRKYLWMVLSPREHHLLMRVC